MILYPMMTLLSNKKLLVTFQMCLHWKKVAQRSYFNFNINTKSITWRGVCFSPDKRLPMARYQEQKVPVTISSFRVNKDSLVKDVIPDYKTQLSQVTPNAKDSFNPIIVPSDTITPIKFLKNAVPEQLVTINGKVHSLTGPKKIFTRNN